MTSPKMEDDLNQNDIGTHLKWKTTSPKMEDDLIKMEEELTQIGR